MKACAVVLLLAGSSLGAANLTSYNDRTAFYTDTQSRTVIDFDTVRNGCVGITDPGGLTVNNINFNGGVSRSVSGGPCSGPLRAFQGLVLLTRLVNRADAPAQGFTTVSLPAGVLAVAFDTGISSDPVVSRIQVTVVTSDSKEQTFTLTSKGTGIGGGRLVEPLFAGFTSSRPMTSIRFKVPDLIDSILILDNFITGRDAPPVVNITGGVANGASFRPGVAANTWITVFGRLLSGATRLWDAGDFSGIRLPTSVEDVNVTINGKAAYVSYVSPGQLNVLTPADLGEGPANILVSRGDLASSPVTVQSQRTAPALFLFDPESRRYAAATHADGSLVGKTSLYPGASTPAKPGEVITLWGTGFGPTSPAVPAGEIVTVPARLVATPVVTIGGAAAEVLYAGLSGAGLYQINVKVPERVADGDMAVVVQIEGVLTQEGPSVTVQH